MPHASLTYSTDPLPPARFSDGIRRPRRSIRKIIRNLRWINPNTNRLTRSNWDVSVQKSSA